MLYCSDSRESLVIVGCPYSKERKLNRADAIVAPNGTNEPSIGYNRGVGELMGA